MLALRRPFLPHDGQLPCPSVADTPNGPFGPERPGASSPIERRAAALDPLFDPTGFWVRRVAVPDTREQRHDGTGFNTMAFGGHLRHKRALALGDVHQLVGG